MNVGVIADLLAQIAASAPAQALKGSFWAYPLVNAAHILGVSLLIGAIVPLDLRILGAFRSTPLRTLARTLVPVAACGLALAALTGGLLFIVKPAEYAASDLFAVKLVVIGVGLINVAAVRINPTWPAIVQGDVSLLDPTEGDRFLKISAAVSLAAWVGALILGRMVGYFM